jgi:hypothetical protein
MLRRGAAEEEEEEENEQDREKEKERLLFLSDFAGNQQEG